MLIYPESLRGEEESEQEPLLILFYTVSVAICLGSVL